MPQIWQIASGESGRYYSKLCLDHDVMIMGPGDLGDFRAEDYYKAVKEGYITSKRMGMIRSLAHKMRPNDIVLLRESYRVVSIGLIIENRYAWMDEFDDVYGWDLQHTQRVIWQDHLNENLDSIQKNGGIFRKRKQIQAFSRVKDIEILNPIKTFFSDLKEREFRDLPTKVPEPLTIEQVCEGMFSRGLPYTAVKRLKDAIDRQRMLLKWYKKYGGQSKRPNEHEVVANMVLPLLLALGWSEQLLAIEWKRIDLAAFQKVPSLPEHCVLVCEAKQLKKGLQDTLAQAKKYVEKKNLSNCKKILLTQGGRFYLYKMKASSGEWLGEPSGYINLEKIRTKHLVPDNTNALDTLMELTPASVLHA